MHGRAWRAVSIVTPASRSLSLTLALSLSRSLPPDLSLSSCLSPCLPASFLLPPSLSLRPLPGARHGASRQTAGLARRRHAQLGLGFPRREACARVCVEVCEDGPSVRTRHPPPPALEQVYMRERERERVHLRVCASPGVLGKGQGCWMWMWVWVSLGGVALRVGVQELTERARTTPYSACCRAAWHSGPWGSIWTCLRLRF